MMWFSASFLLSTILANMPTIIQQASIRWWVGIYLRSSSVVNKYRRQLLCIIFPAGQNTYSICTEVVGTARNVWACNWMET